jgi:hypothetical protein
MAWAGMVRMGMGDDGARHRAQRVDIKIAGHAIKPLRRGFQPALRMRAQSLPPGLQACENRKIILHDDAIDIEQNMKIA